MAFDEMEPQEIESDEPVIDRFDTFLRMVYTLLFFVVNEVLGSVVGLVVVFELVYSLVTQRAPSLRVREFANRIVAYGYRLERWVTHNEPDIPFPFSDFPDTVEPSRWPYRSPGEPDPLRDA